MFMYDLDPESWHGSWILPPNVILPWILTCDMDPGSCILM